MIEFESLYKMMSLCVCVSDFKDDGMDKLSKQVRADELYGHWTELRGRL